MLQTAAGAAQLGRQQKSSSSSSSRDYVSCIGQLQQLQLRGLLVDNPSRCRTHGSSDCSCQVSVGQNNILPCYQHMLIIPRVQPRGEAGHAQTLSRCKIDGWIVK
jgi:hypothetical protein